MSKPLVERLVDLDRTLDGEYATRVAERERIIADARSEALALTKAAETGLGKTREEAVRTHDTAMHRAKEAILTAARTEAAAITRDAAKRQADAADYLLARVTEDTA